MATHIGFGSVHIHIHLHFDDSGDWDYEMSAKQLASLAELLTEAKLGDWSTEELLDRLEAIVESP
jgi:hypothetical protein